eukprot:scaffold12623_cov174-Isochrysis_galbana.AAC.1
MIGRAPGGKIKGGGEKGGNASLPGDSRVSRRIRPLALLIFKKKIPSAETFATGGLEGLVLECECANLRGAEIPHQGVIIHGGDRGFLATACARRRGTLPHRLASEIDG